MTVMSSQRFRDAEIVAAKKAELIESGATMITVPVVRAYMQDLDGNELYIMYNKHHTLEAAKELGLQVEFEEVTDDLSSYIDIENQNGEAICASYYMDSDWYYIHNDDESLNDVEVW